jgi:hypothetical protein
MEISMNIMKSAALITAILMLAGCMEVNTNPSLPQWEVEVDAPITKVVVKAEDIIPEDSLIHKEAVVGEDGFQYVFKDTVDIEEQEVGDQLKLDAISPQTISQSVDDVTVEGTEKNFESAFDTLGIDPITNSTLSELGNIELSDTDPASTPAITMTEVFPNLPDDGQSYTIPQGTDFDPIKKDIEFTDFSSATFVNGELEVKIVNDLVVELGYPIQVELLKTDLTPIGSGLVATWNTGVMPGDSSSRFIDVSGETLPGNMTVRVSGKIAGSGDASGVVDESVRNSSFVIKSQARNLVVSQATAIVPEQVIDTTSFITLAAEEKNKVQRAVIEEGNLGITIQNDLPVNAVIDLQVSSLDQNPDQSGVQPFARTINVPADQNTNVTYDINDMALVMDVSDQTVYYSYEIRTEDTSPSKVPLSKNDDFQVDMNIYGVSPSEQITFKRITGIVEPQDILESGEIDVSSDSEIQEAYISRGSITIEVDNQINLTNTALPNLVLDMPEFFNTSGDPIREERELGPGLTTIVIPLANHILVPQTRISGSELKQYITYQSHVTTPADELGSYDVTDSIRVNIRVTELKFSKVTGKFSQEAMVTDSVITLDDDNKLDRAILQKGNLNLVFTNNIGVIADVVFRLPELLKDGHPFREVIHLSDDAAPQEFTVPLDGYVLDLDYTSPDVDQQIAYRSTISLPEDSVMTLSLNQEIAVDVQLTDMSFSEVSGYIDTVTVEIDPIEQSITSLPEELKNVDLADVSIQVVFDSQIDVPVYLDLNITSENEEGETVNVSVSQNITDNPVVDIPNAKDLINIFPNKITASGQARVVGEGTVRQTDVVKGNLFLSAPIAFEIGDSVYVELDVEEMEETDIPKEFKSAVLNAKVDNLFKFGAEVTVLGSPDSNYLKIPEHPDVIEIARLEVDAADTSLQVLEIGEDVIEFLKDGGYIKADVWLKGPEDGTTSRLLTTDSMTVWLYGTFKALIGAEDEEEN